MMVMKKLRSSSFQTISRLFLQILAVITLLVAIGWLIFEPGFEPVLAILGSVAVFVSPLFLIHGEKAKEGSLPLIDECESVAEIQLGTFDVDGGQAGNSGGGVVNFLYDYRVYFGGRQDELKMLDAWLTQTEKPFGLLVAPAGMGKSALVANWLELLQDRAVVVFHPISLRYGTNSKKQTLHSLLTQMSDIARKEAGLAAEQSYVRGLDLIDESFNKEELQELCFHLSVDYDNLSEGGKRDKALKLIQLCRRKERLGELAAACREMQPHRDWEAAFSRSTPDRLLYEPPREGDDERLLSIQLRDNLRRPTGWGKPLVVIIDGLDELANQLNQSEIKPIDFLPNQAGSGIYILAVARGESNIVRGTWQGALGWEKAPVQHFSLGSLKKEDIRAMVRQRGLTGGNDDALELITDEVYRVSKAGDPLIASLWVDRLADQPVKEIERLLQILQESEPGINEYIRGILAQLEPVMSEAAMPLFELLSLARGPLTVNDLQALGIKTDSVQLNRLVSLSGRLIIGGAQHGYVLSHSRIRQAVQDKYVSEECRDDWLEQFHRYGRCVLKQAKETPAGKQPVVPNHYILNHYAEHLQEDTPPGYEASLYALVDEVWMKVHYNAPSSSYGGFLADVRRAWMTAEKIGKQELEGGELVSTIGIQMKCALITSSIATLMGNLPPALPAMLVRDEKWQPDQAIQYASMVPDTLQRIRTRLALLRSFSQKEEFKQHIGQTTSSALDDLKKLTDQNHEELRARLLLILFPFLIEPDHIERAIKQAKSLRSIAWRVRLLGHLVKRQPTREQQIALLAGTLRSCAKIRFSYSPGSRPNDASEGLKPYVLDAIALNLPSGILGSALRIAFDVSSLDENSYELTKLLSMLARHIPENMSEEFLQTCLEIHKVDSHAAFIPNAIIHLAPRLSINGILLAHKYLTNKVDEVGKYGNPFGLFASESGYFARSSFVALIVLAHFCVDTEIKEQIGKLLGEKLLPLRPSYDDDVSHMKLRFRTILAVYKTIFKGQTDEELAGEIADGNIEFEYILNDVDALFCLLGPESMKAVIEQRYATGIGSSGGLNIRSSSYYLAAVANQLPDENLDWIMKIAADDDMDYKDYRKGIYWNYEMWGRFRAIASVAPRLSLEQRQDYAQLAIEPIYDFDSGLEALKSLARTLSVEAIESLVTSQQPWKTWLRLEQISDLLDADVCTVVRQKLYTNLQKNTYNIKLAQPLVVLSTSLNAEQSQPIWDTILEKASFIADLPNQIETIRAFSSRAAGKSRRWRSILKEQVREEALTSGTSNYPLSKMPFRYRVQVLHRSLGLWSIFKLAVTDLWQIILELVSIVSDVLVFVFKLFPKLVMWVDKKWFSRNEPVKESHQASDPDRYKAFLGRILPDIEILGDKPLSEQREALSKIYVELQRLDTESRRWRQIMRQHGPSIWHSFPRDLYDLALQGVVPDGEYEGDNDHLNNLLAVLPGIVNYREDLLVEWRNQIELFWHHIDKAILISALAYYQPPKEQIAMLEEALSLSKTDVDPGEADWLCGLVLQDAAQYVPESLLRVIAQSFVDYHKGNNWSRVYIEAFEQMIPRIGTNLNLIGILWPLIENLDDYGYPSYASFVETVAPNLNKEYVAKLLILTSEKDTRKSLSDAYVSLRTRWRGLTQNDAYDIWCSFLCEISSLARADFLDRMQWFSGVVEDLGGQAEVEKVGDAVLEVGRWQWL